METFNRRDALKGAVAWSACEGAGLAAATDQDKKPDHTKPSPKDREFVIEAGMTPDEADCWELIAEAAGKFFTLPKLHPMDAQEVASAIHIVQNKLLSRPTYRRYLDNARKGNAK